MEGNEARARGAQAFSRRYRLGKSRNYRYVYRRGKSIPSRNLVLIYLKGREQRFGFSVSAKVGNAVVRNRIRRCLREDVRLMRTELKCGKYIIVARPALKTVPHAEMTRELRALMERGKLFRSADN